MKKKNLICFILVILLIIILSIILLAKKEVTLKEKFSAKELSQLETTSFNTLNLGNNVKNIYLQYTLNSSPLTNESFKNIITYCDSSGNSNNEEFMDTILMCPHSSYKCKTSQKKIAREEINKIDFEEYLVDLKADLNAVNSAAIDSGRNVNILLSLFVPSEYWENDTTTRSRSNSIADMLMSYVNGFLYSNLNLI